MRVAAIAWCTAIPGLQVYLFRRTLPDLWKNHMEGPSGFPAMLAQWTTTGLAKIIYSHPGEIRFPNGSKIFLCHCQHEKDIYSFQGAEIHVLMIDELTQWLASMYKYLRGRVRMVGLKVPAQYEGMFPRVLVGANPGGIGHNWVKAGWISLAKPLAITQMPRSEAGMRRQYIPAKLEDNPIGRRADPTYEDRLEGLGTPALVKAMRTGDWNIVAGGALDDVWSDRVAVPRFKVPATWRVDRSFDWGSTHPFSVLWWAEADGTEATLPNGRKFCPKPRSLVLVHEWYGGKEGATNEGLKLGPRKVASGILEREKELLDGKWVATTPLPGPADNQIRDVRDDETPTLESEMAEAGVYWRESDKSPGSRKIGLELMRSRLSESAKDYPEDAGLYVMDHNVGVLSRWPVLPRDPNKPDDVDTKSEDHDYDAARYRILGPKPEAMSINMGVAR